MSIDEIALLISILVFIGFGLFVILKAVYDRWKYKRQIEKYFSIEANKIKVTGLIYRPNELHCFPCKCDQKQDCWHFWLTYYAYQNKKNNYTLWTPSSDHSYFCEYFKHININGKIPD